MDGGYSTQGNTWPFAVLGVDISPVSIQRCQIFIYFQGNTKSRGKHFKVYSVDFSVTDWTATYRILNKLP